MVEVVRMGEGEEEEAWGSWVVMGFCWVIVVVTCGVGVSLVGELVVGRLGGWVILVCVGILCGDYGRA